MAEDLKDIIGHIYDNFIMRDIAYVFSGILLFTAAIYIYDNAFIIALDYITKDFFKFLIFLITCYFTGLMSQEAGKFIGIVRTRSDIPEPYKDSLVLLSDIQKYYGKMVNKIIERRIYLKHVGAAIGSSSFIGTLLLLFPLIRYQREKDLIIVIIFLSLTIIGLKENRIQLKRQNETYMKIVEEMLTTKKIAK